MSTADDISFVKNYSIVIMEGIWQRPEIFKSYQTNNISIKEHQQHLYNYSATEMKPAIYAFTV